MWTWTRKLRPGPVWSGRGCTHNSLINSLTIYVWSSVQPIYVSVALEKSTEMQPIQTKLTQGRRSVGPQI